MDEASLASDLVYVFVLPFAAIATTYLYFDLLSRQEGVASGGRRGLVRPRSVPHG
ncbi:MAG TPA: hypothetical protein VGK69_06780 [Gaiellaceae bacterium]